jgi:hypothetical protein
LDIFGEIWYALPQCISFEQLVAKVQKTPHAGGANKIFARIFYTFRPIWIKLCRRVVNKNLLSHFEFRENRSSETHTLLGGGGGGKSIFAFPFPTYWPICVTFWV